MVSNFLKLGLGITSKDNVLVSFSQHTNVNASMQMYVAWGITKKSETRAGPAELRSYWHVWRLLWLECWKEGCGLYRKDGQGRRGVSVALCVSDHLECTELCFGIEKVPTKSLWVRVKRRTSTDNIIWGSATGHLTKKPMENETIPSTQASNSTHPKQDT